MALNMMVWENDNGKLKILPKNRLDDEARLEDWIANDASLLGLEILIIGRQVRTPFGGRIDLLGIDASGDVLILELKRDRTPREIVAQILDYASWVNELTHRDIVELAKQYLSADLSEAFFKRFDVELPEVVNTNHRMLIVASEFDDSSERIVQYLSSRHSLDINAVFFSCFNFGEKEFVGRSWLIDPEQVEERSESRRKSPWSGYWFVNVGEGKHRNWDDCRKYGFLSAGQGERYSEPLKKLNIGDQIFAYMKSRGYVGFGVVTQVAQVAKDFIPKGSDKPLFALPLEEEGIKENAEDSELCEWVIGVEWKKTFSRDDARYFKGLFANQNIVCKLRHTQTFEFLKGQFEVKQ